MYPILEKRLLAEGIWLMKVLAPRVARSAQPGQFVIVRADEHGERIPLTISHFVAGIMLSPFWLDGYCFRYCLVLMCLN